MSEQSQGSAKTPEESIPKEKLPVESEVYNRIMGELKDAKSKLKTYEAEKQQSSDNKLKENNEWKALAEQKEKTLLETTTKLNQLESTILDSVKLNAFQRALGGKIKSDEYYQFVDTDKIAYNPETKRVDEESVKQVVADFVKKHSSLVEFKTPKMPNESAAGGKVGNKGINEMTTAEIENELRKLGKI